MMTLRKNNKMEQLEEVVDEGVKVNATNEEGNTLLHIASQQGLKRICKFLLSIGKLYCLVATRSVSKATCNTSCLALGLIALPYIIAIHHFPLRWLHRQEWLVRQRLQGCSRSRHGGKSFRPTETDAGDVLPDLHEGPCKLRMLEKLLRVPETK